MAQPVVRVRDQAIFYPRVAIENQPTMVYSSRLNDARRQLLFSASQNRNPQAALEQFYNANNINDVLNQADDINNAQGKDSQIHQIANFIQKMAAATVGRGENKQVETPAQQSGIRPRNPNLFGVEAKDPIPYHQIIQDRQKINAVLGGYGEDTNNPNATLLAQVMRSHTLLQEAFTKDDSLYNDMPTNSAVNLYNIKVRNDRRDRLLNIL